ncbi:MAG: lysophospholipase [Bacilli bacterium]|nr:lysophospholipase [Bacilli bacterium]
MNKRLISIKTVNNDVLSGFAWEVNQPKGCIFIATGMEECAERYDSFANFFNENNYNVYSIDYYGQGENVQNLDELGIVPRSAFSKFVRVLDDLVKKYAIKGLPVIVFGHSMGSFIVQDYIQRYAKHANKAIICGTDGPNSKFTYSIGYQLARLVCKMRGENKKGKFLRSLAIGAYAKSVKHRETDCDWLSYDKGNVERYIADPKCGKGSSNGFYRELLKGNHRLYKGKFLNKINKDLKIFVPAGTEDPVGHKGKGPTKLVKMYQKLGIKDVTLKLYPNMRHEIHNETDKDSVLKDFLEFIEK